LRRRGSATAHHCLTCYVASRAALPATRSSFSLPASRDCELPHAKVLPIPRCPAWRRVPDFGGWIPLRTLERSTLPALPPSLARTAMDDSNAPLKSLNLLELALAVALVLGMAVLAVWGVMWLFRASPSSTPPRPCVYRRGHRNVPTDFTRRRLSLQERRKTGADGNGSLGCQAD
jgi:hypothetical protein